MESMPDIQNMTKADTSVFDMLSKDNHEQVLFCNDADTGLKAIIAIHNTTLGPALGGTRMWQYATEKEALIDVLRLSRGMTYKAAITGLNLGGGKAVIIGDSSKDKTEPLLRKFGRFVQNLNGKYITAEDVGISTKDMEFVHMETEHVTGLPESLGGGGDPSPVTAYGVYLGMKASAKVAWGSDNLVGKKVVVEGVGKVGRNLIQRLVKDGAKVYVTDINKKAIKNITDTFDVQFVEPGSQFDIDMDIYAPCAMGATVNDDTIPRMNCKIIAGAANNQLQKDTIHGPALLEKGIIYAPDFLINAGGLINVYSELEGYNRKKALNATENIYDVTLHILRKSMEEKIPTYLAAKKIAEKRISDIKKVKSTY